MDYKEYEQLKIEEPWRLALVNAQQGLIEPLVALYKESRPPEKYEEPIRRLFADLAFKKINRGKTKITAEMRASITVAALTFNSKWNRYSIESIASAYEIEISECRRLMSEEKSKMVNKIIQDHNSDVREKTIIGIFNTYLTENNGEEYPQLIVKTSQDFRNALKSKENSPWIIIC